MRKRCFGVFFFADPDTAEGYGETRSVGLGVSRGRILQVVFMERGPDIVRIISLRKATRREIEQYEKKIQDGLEEG